jgi:hypothetical protein
VKRNCSVIPATDVSPGKTNNVQPIMVIFPIAGLERSKFGEKNASVRPGIEFGQQPANVWLLILLIFYGLEKV